MELDERTKQIIARVKQKLQLAKTLPNLFGSVRRPEPTVAKSIEDQHAAVAAKIISVADAA